MAETIYFNNVGNQGKLGLSQRAFDQIVTIALSKIPEIAVSSTQLKKNQKSRLNRPVQTTIKHGIAHVWVAVDVKKGVNIMEISKRIQDEIILTLELSTEQIPFDIQVKVESLI